MKSAKQVLKHLKLRPTLQRLAITDMLLNKGNIHITAFSLEKMLRKKNFSISRATIYNNLNELSSKGFLKKVLVKKDKMWFDTNLSKHHHFYDEEEDSLVDLEEKESTVNDLELMELGTVIDGKTVKSYQSKTSFNTSEIINIVKNIIPKSYTKSEVSNDTSVINDIKSEHLILIRSVYNRIY